MSRFPATETAEDRRRRRREEDAALLLALFLWSPRDISYYTRQGQRVPQRVVRGVVNAIVATTREDVTALSRQVSAGDIDVAEWQDGVARRLKTMHTATAGIASGGFNNMSPAALARLQGTLEFHLLKLEGFAQDIAEGVTRIRSVQVDSETGELQQVVRLVRMTEERIVSRAEMYVEAGASDSYEGGRRDAAVLAGFRFERNVLNPADHCDGCLGEDARGWVGIGQLVPIGRRDCLVRCRCQMQFARELPVTAV